MEVLHKGKYRHSISTSFISLVGTQGVFFSSLANCYTVDGCPRHTDTHALFVPVWCVPTSWDAVFSTDLKWPGSNVLGCRKKDIINIQCLKFIMCGKEEQEKAVFIAHVLYPVKRVFRKEDHLASCNVVRGNNMTIVNHPDPRCPLKHTQRSTSHTTLEQFSTFLHYLLPKITF